MWICVKFGTLYIKLHTMYTNVNMCSSNSIPIQQTAQYLSLSATALGGAVFSCRRSRERDNACCDFTFCSAPFLSLAELCFLCICFTCSNCSSKLFLLGFKLVNILCRNLITGSTHLSHFATKFSTPAHNYFREENKITALWVREVITKMYFL